MYNERTVDLSLAVVGIMVLGLILLLISRLTVFIFGVCQENSFLKKAIEQADSPEERRYWERERKALYLSVIPGISRQRAIKIAHRRKKKR